MAVKCPGCKTSFTPFEILEGRAQCPTCGQYIEIAEEPKAAPKSSDEPSASTGTGTNGAISKIESGTGTGSSLIKPDEEKYVKIKPGQELAGFRIEDILGAGAMAVVYKATQLSLNRPVALKILPERFAKNPSFIERFDKESDALAALNHPNIVGIIDRGHEGNTYFFAMEYVEGTNLRELMLGGQLSLEFFVRIMKQCCDGLAYAHSKNIIHRDLKPSNIMLNEQGIAKVADFGLAGMLLSERQADQKKRKRVVMGTRGYMAPEQEIDISQTDVRSDIYALGAVMYEVLTGDVPKDRPFRPPSQVNPKADPRLDATVMKCLEELPDKRYQSAKALGEDIERFLTALTAVGELCPNCHSQNPIREKKCVKCGHDLSELFDVCPECKQENRRDVELCVKCGANLQSVRQQYSVQIGKLQNQARELMKRGLYNEALTRLRPILNVPGRIFEYARQRSADLIKECERRKAEYYQKLRQKALGLVSAGQPDRALEALKQIPQGELDVSQDIEILTRNMDICKKKVATAAEQVKAFVSPAAAKLLDEVEKIWKECPGLKEARQSLDQLIQSESMIDYEIQEADRLLSEGNFIGAREALQFAMSTMPEHPKVKGKMEEIGRRERAQAVEGFLREAKGCFEERRYEEAAFHWKSAADLLPDGDAHKAKLLQQIDMAKEKALGPDAVKPKAQPAAPAAAPTEAAPAKRKTQTELRVREAPKNRKMIVIVAVVAGLILLVGGGFLLYSLSKGKPPNEVVKPGPKAEPNGKPKVQPPEKGSQTPPEKPPEPPPTQMASGPFTEDFDSGDAPNWQVLSGQWRALSTGRRPYRSLSPDTPALSEHKLFNAKDVGVSASVSIDSAETGKNPFVAVQVRRDGRRAVALQIEGVSSDQLEAKLVALDAGLKVRQTAGTRIPLGLNRFMALRIDAVGPKVAASVDGRKLPFIEDLPAEFNIAGRVAIEARSCRTSWDDITLGPADASNIPEKQIVVAPPPPKEPEGVPLSEVTPPRIGRVSLSKTLWAFSDSLKSEEPVWQSVQGKAKWSGGRVSSGGYAEVLMAATATEASNMEVRARCRIDALDDKNYDKIVGIVARCVDGRNYLMLGLRTSGQAYAEPVLLARLNGRDTVAALSKPKILIPLGENVDFQLAVVGDRATGTINGKTLVELRNVDKAAPKSGMGGIYSRGMNVSWDVFNVQSETMPAVDIPKGAQVKALPNQIDFDKARLDAVTVKGIEAKDGLLEVTFKLLESTTTMGIPQLALHGRMNQKDEELWLNIDMTTKGQPCRVTLWGKVELGGRVQRGKYAQAAGPAVWYGESVKLGLKMTGNTVTGYINGQQVISHSHSTKLPIPQVPGAWGFRATYMQATATEIKWTE